MSMLTLKKAGKFVNGVETCNTREVHKAMVVKNLLAAVSKSRRDFIVNRRDKLFFKTETILVWLSLILLKVLLVNLIMLVRHGKRPLLGTNAMLLDGD